MQHPEQVEQRLTVGLPMAASCKLLQLHLQRCSSLSGLLGSHLRAQRADVVYCGWIWARHPEISTGLQRGRSACSNNIQINKSHTYAAALD